MTQTKQQIETLQEELSKVVIGRDKELKLLFTALLSKGHVLLEDLPGMGKTTMAKAFAHILDCSFSRIQCTADLMPSDVLGTAVYHPKTGEFTFRKGPVFTNILLVDEINRALPRTQSSFLESMEEQQVSIEGETFQLDDPFLVLATQNPIEMEGTFPLPEAQLDRFLMKIRLGYPTQEQEVEMLEKVGTTLPYHEINHISNPASIVDMQKQCEAIWVHTSLLPYIISLATETRNHPLVEVGVSPRATKTLYKTMKTWAFLHGRDYVLPDDIKEVLPHVWGHRLIMKAEAQVTDNTSEAVLYEILERVAVPKEIVRRNHE